MRRLPHRCLSALLAVALPFTILLGATRLAAAPDETSYPPQVSLDDVQAVIDEVPATHPRLLATAETLAELRRSLDEDSLRGQLMKAVIRGAEALLDAPPIERKQQGRRLLGQSRRCVKRMATLAMAYQLTGRKAYAQRGEKEMLAIAAFRDWNPSHFLDVAEMTFGLAIGYDWLFDALGKEARAEISKAIVEKGVSLPLRTRHRGWIRARNNWGQVCHGGLCAGALAVIEEERNLAARTVLNALQNVTYSMAAYAPNGAYPEGPGYWAYGTSYNVLLIGVLESALGTDFGLTKAPGFSETGRFPALACGPSGLYFNYADGGSHRSPQPVLYWFADRYDRPDWLLGEAKLLRRELADLRPRDALGGGNRLLPFALLWMEPETKLEPDTIRMPLHFSGGGEVPITIHRSSWKDPRASFVGLKAGSPSANHGQMDIGSFVLDADGVRWALDLGAEGYHGIESRGMNLWDRSQDSDRWKIFRQQNQGHNTLVIDGKLQKAAAKGTILHFSAEPSFPHSVVDMSPVYEGQAKVVHRGVTLLGSREVLIYDHLEGLRPGSRVRWGLITRGEPERLGGKAVVLHQGDERLTLTILKSPGSTWSEVNTEKPRNEWDSPNRGTRGIVLEAVAPESGELELAVLATPGSTKESARDMLKLIPPASWGR